MTVADRWHKSHPAAGEARCSEHRGKVPTSEHGQGDRWQVRWRDDRGDQRKRNFARQPDAKSFDAEIRTRIDSGTAVDLAAGRTLVQAYAASWRASLTSRPSTAERLDRVFRLHVDPLPLGALRMSQVRASHMRAWAKDRAEVLAPSTMAVVWSNVAAMFAAAVLDRAIGVSPCTGIRPPSAPPAVHYIPSADQVRAVADALPERYRAIAWLAAGCGWRRNEVLGVELDAVDFLRRTAEVRQQLLTATGEKPFIGPPKTRTSPRVNELPQVAAEALARHLGRYPVVPQEIEDRTVPHKPSRRLASLVFTTSTGAPVIPAYWAKLWRTAADTAGIPKGTGVHCLRHYYATLLIHEGRDVKTVQLAMGHATPMITLNTYAGEWPDSAGSTRSIVDSAFGNVPAVCPDLEEGRS